MSLINDALNRAKQQPAPDGVSEESLSPVQHQPGPKLPFFMIPVAFVAVVVVAVWFVMKGVEVARDDSSQKESVTAREPATAGGAVGASADLPGSPEPAVTVNEPVIVSETVVQKVAPAPAPVPVQQPPVVAPAPPAVPTFPEIKLQAIFFGTRNPAVVLNGKTVEVGQRLNDVRVISINRQSVIVDWKGERKELFLP